MTNELKSVNQILNEIVQGANFTVRMSDAELFNALLNGEASMNVKIEGFDLTNPTDGYVITYDEATETWIPKEGSGPAIFTVGTGIDSIQSKDNLAEGYQSIAMGYQSYASGTGAVAIGGSCSATGDQSHAEGMQTTASAYAAHAEGNESLASGPYSHAEGNATTASGNTSHAEGQGTTASEECTHAEGYGSTASGIYAHAEGENTLASGYDSHAEGGSTTAAGTHSHAEGSSTQANGNFSHAQGYESIADGMYSHAEGAKANARMQGMHAHRCSRFNVAQYGRVVVGGTVSTADPTELLIEGTLGTRRISVPFNYAMNFRAQVVCSMADGKTACFNIIGRCKNYNNTVSVAGVAVTTVHDEINGTLAVTAVADDTNKALVIQVTGVALNDIVCGATVEWTEITF